MDVIILIGYPSSSLIKTISPFSRISFAHHQQQKDCYVGPGTWDSRPHVSFFYSLLSPSIAHYPKHITNIGSGWSRGLLLTPSIGLPYLPCLAYASKCVSIPNNHIIIAPCHITQQQQQLQQRQQQKPQPRDDGSPHWWRFPTVHGKQTR